MSVGDVQRARNQISLKFSKQSAVQQLLSRWEGCLHPHRKCKIILAESAMPFSSIINLTIYILKFIINKNSKAKKK